MAGERQLRPALARDYVHRGTLARFQEAFLDVMTLACQCDAMHGYTCVAHERYFNLEAEARRDQPPEPAKPPTGEGT